MIPQRSDFKSERQYGQALADYLKVDRHIFAVHNDSRKRRVHRTFDEEGESAARAEAERLGNTKSTIATWMSRWRTLSSLMEEHEIEFSPYGSPEGEKKPRRRIWNRDESLIALDFYLRYTPSFPAKTSKEIVALSTKIRALRAALGDKISGNFRSPDAVYMKLMNFRRVDPEYKGKGLSRGAGAEEIVWKEYAHKPDELRRVVANIGLRIDAISPDLEFAERALTAIERGSRPGGQGFGLTAKERTAVEKRAMKLAQAALENDGYEVADMHAKKPYDLRANKDGEDICVEVKGTTGPLGQIVLTANEVTLHRECFPDNALFIAHSIKLKRSKTQPKASGGILVRVQPWRIDENKLKPMAFRYDAG